MKFFVYGFTRFPRVTDGGVKTPNQGGESREPIRLNDRNNYWNDRKTKTVCRCFYQKVNTQKRKTFRDWN